MSLVGFALDVRVCRHIKVETVFRVLNIALQKF